MMIGTIIQRIVIVAFVGVLFCGCVGVRTYELSGPSNEISTEGLALMGKPASITLVDGTLHEGWIAQVQDDSLTICLEEPPDTLIVESGSIYAISISGCTSCRTAGAVFGGLIGVAAGGTKRMDHSSNLSFQMNYDPILYGVVGSALGGTLVGIITPPKRYLFGQAPALLDTLRVRRMSFRIQANGLQFGKAKIS